MTRLARNLVLMVCLIFASGTPIPASVPQTPQKIAELPLVVHLRRIHLVRPDLIPYPIAYAIVC